MFVSYTTLEKSAKIWIYQSDREILDTELNTIKKELHFFCDHVWTSHGQTVKCSFKLFNWFLCLFVDESGHKTSGCSIDSSVKYIKNLQNKYDVDFFNRTNIAFLDNQNTKILPLEEFKLIIKPDMMIYNNLVKTKEEFETEWIIPLYKSWLNKYLKK